LIQPVPYSFVIQFIIALYLPPCSCVHVTSHNLLFRLVFFLFAPLWGNTDKRRPFPFPIPSGHLSLPPSLRHAPPPPIPPCPFWSARLSVASMYSFSSLLCSPFPHPPSVRSRSSSPPISRSAARMIIPNLCYFCLPHLALTCYLRYIPLPFFLCPLPDRFLLCLESHFPFSTFLCRVGLEKISLSSPCSPQCSLSPRRWTPFPFKEVSETSPGPLSCWNLHFPRDSRQGIST